MTKLTIDIDDSIMKVLKKRAKQNMLSIREMAEDIVRRSMVSWVGGPRRRSFKIDDKLVGAFSRERRGPKKGSKRKKRKK